MPDAVDKDIDDDQNLGEPLDKPEHHVGNPNNSCCLLLRGAHCQCVEWPVIIYTISALRMFLRLWQLSKQIKGLSLIIIAIILQS